MDVSVVALRDTRAVSVRDTSQVGAVRRIAGAQCVAVARHLPGVEDRISVEGRQEAGELSADLGEDLKVAPRHGLAGAREERTGVEQPDDRRASVQRVAPGAFPCQRRGNLADGLSSLR